MRLGVVMLLIPLLTSCHRKEVPPRDPMDNWGPARCSPGSSGPLRRLGPADCVQDFCAGGAMVPQAVPCPPATDNSVDAQQIVVPAPFICPDKPPAPGKPCDIPGACDIATACPHGSGVVNVACANAAWVVKVTWPCPRVCPPRAANGPVCAPHESCVFTDNPCLHASCVDGAYHTNPAPCAAPKP